MRTWIITAACALVVSTAGSAPSDGPTAYPCYLNVYAPVGATLTVNGTRTGQMTELRHFVSPPLTAGKSFYYNFAAYYTSNGQPVIRKQQVEVTAGANVVVNMFEAPLAKTEMPVPKPAVNAFDTPKKTSDTPDTPKKSAPVETPKKSK